MSQFLLLNVMNCVVCLYKAGPTSRHTAVILWKVMKFSREEYVPGLRSNHVFNSVIQTLAPES